MQNLLEVNHLKTYFHTRSGVVKAVDDVSFTLGRGEVMGIVGESGSGKSVTALSLMRLIASPPGRIDEDSEILFQGTNVLDLTADELHQFRGGKVSMVFQDSMTSLNPVFTVGFQITETIKAHLKLTAKDAADQTLEMMHKVGIPDAVSKLSARVQRRPAPAYRHCPCPGTQSGLCGLR